ncbi:helix-turn-helix domain-containing protein [Brevundimonas sp. S30B]|uniref:helix-turn-helix domain-containing protein n=1 Tax=unclassified Brevundimonas TaxID=2622653 RepID=UPI0010721856|nr:MULTISPECIES: helix-turn-helix domain-containing protein [unclassified Brevundimonas]QBX38655.1 helix-turn-helix domain-containing protein [Brevundimonas sp. MF30-B]TFW01246.1 helix-turn-helix domain-containing protein [Brevundimonas sp. S30B]
MSVQAITWALEQACATATEKAVLLVVANYVGPDGTTFVGQETISEQACCSVKTVERALATFEGMGWIERERRHRKDGSRTSDLIISKGPKHPERRENVQPDTKSVRRAPNRQPVQTKQTSCPNLPDTVSGLTSFEPLEEPLEEAAAVAQAPETVSPAVVETPALAPASDWPEGDTRRHAELLAQAAQTVRLDPARQPGLTLTAGRLAAWRRDGASWEHDVVPVVTTIAAKRGPLIASWKFFDAAIAQSISDNAAALTLPEARHASPAHVQLSDRQSARRANRDRASAGADWASEVMAARRAL